MCRNAKDIDLILVMPEEWDITIEMFPQEYYNLVSPMMIEEEFDGIHIFVVPEHSSKYHSWIRYFSDIKDDWRFMFDMPEYVSKGLVRVTL